MVFVPTFRRDSPGYRAVRGKALTKDERVGAGT